MVKYHLRCTIGPPPPNRNVTMFSHMLTLGACRSPGAWRYKALETEESIQQNIQRITLHLP